VGLILLKIYNININLLFPFKNSVETTELAKLPKHAQGMNQLLVKLGVVLDNDYLFYSIYEIYADHSGLAV
jgi:hypothetical protein